MQTIVLSAQTERDLEKQIERYLRQYPANFYSTTVDRRWTENGKVLASLSRFDSCD